jgi:hypothetical protein
MSSPWNGVVEETCTTPLDGPTSGGTIGALEDPTPLNLKHSITK